MNSSTLGVSAFAVGVLVAAGTVVVLDLVAPKYGIIIRATDSDISPDKWTDIETKVLNIPSTNANADPRDMLYRVGKFVDGKQIGPDSGKMDESLLLEDRRVPGNFTGHAFQIGVGAKEKSQKIPSVTKMPQAHFRPNITESQEMVKEVNDILGQH